MAHIVATAETSTGREVAMLVERLSDRVLADGHAAEELSESIARATADAARREARDNEPPGRARCQARVW